VDDEDHGMDDVVSGVDVDQVVVEDER